MSEFKSAVLQERTGCSDGGCCFHLSKPPPSLHQWLLGQWWGLYRTSAVMLRLRPSEALPEGVSWEPGSNRNGSNATATLCSSILKAFVCCYIWDIESISSVHVCSHLSCWVHCVLDQCALSVSRSRTRFCVSPQFPHYPFFTHCCSVMCLHMSCSGSPHKVLLVVPTEHSLWY